MLSIIIPTYNSENTINKCINSIILMNISDYEILLIDDGSNDKTLKINNRYALKYSNIHSFHQNNKGASSARNVGLHYAKGDWICFVDSDDYINSDCFKYILSHYLSSSVSLVVSNINFKGKILGTKHYKKCNTHEFIENNYPLYGNEIVHVLWNKLYNNKIIRKYNLRFISNMTMGEDLVFNLRYMSHINKLILQIPLIYYHYNFHTNSISESFNSNELSDQSYILYYLKKIFIKQHISLKIFDNLKVKSIRAIMNNGIEKKNQCKQYLITQKQFINNGYIGNIHCMNLSIKNFFLFLIFKQPLINLLYNFLIIKSFVKRII